MWTSKDVKSLQSKKQGYFKNVIVIDPDIHKSGVCIVRDGDAGKVETMALTFVECVSLFFEETAMSNPASIIVEAEWARKEIPGHGFFKFDGLNGKVKFNTSCYHITPTTTPLQAHSVGVNVGRNAQTSYLLCQLATDMHLDVYVCCGMRKIGSAVNRKLKAIDLKEMYDLDVKGNADVMDAVRIAMEAIGKECTYNQKLMKRLINNN